MTVYVDEVFVLNLLIDGVLLRCAAVLIGRHVRAWRVWLAALVGALYAVAALLPGWGRIAGLPGRIAVFLGMCAIAFGLRRDALKPSLWYFGVCCGFFGLAWALSVLTGRGVLLLGGAVWYAVSFRFLALLAGLCYGLIRLLLPRLGRHAGGEVQALTLRLGARSVGLSALRDTGNCLRDPVSGAPVLVVEREIARRLLPELPWSDGLLRDPAAALPLVRALAPRLKPRLIPYRAVGTPASLLLAFGCVCIPPGRRRERSVLAAVSPTPLSDGGSYQALIGGKL